MDDDPEEKNDFDYFITDWQDVIQRIRESNEKEDKPLCFGKIKRFYDDPHYYCKHFWDCQKEAGN